VYTTWQLSWRIVLPTTQILSRIWLVLPYYAPEIHHYKRCSGITLIKTYARVKDRVTDVNEQIGSHIRKR
jgi:hypothetical protein